MEAKESMQIQCAQTGLKHWGAGMLHHLFPAQISVWDPLWTLGRTESLWGTL